jgi:hypothetical protein
MSGSIFFLKDKFDLYLLGSSTWGEDEIELQEDFEPFYESVNGDLNLSGKKFAVFGAEIHPMNIFAELLMPLSNVWGSCVPPLCVSLSELTENLKSQK